MEATGEAGDDEDAGGLDIDLHGSYEANRQLFGELNVAPGLTLPSDLSGAEQFFQTNSPSISFAAKSRDTCETTGTKHPYEASGQSFGRPGGPADTHAVSTSLPTLRSANQNSAVRHDAKVNTY